MPTIDALPLAFPGHAIQAGESDPEIVLAIQRRLNAAGCGPLAENGRFGSPTTVAVKRFQMRFTDADGLPLKVDGIVGPVTWAALFGTSSPVREADAPLLSAAVEQAAAEIGVLEVPPG
jgi:peptidoglycan hydrolase-like protein with peptidoglycan-binding domain